MTFDKTENTRLPGSPNNTDIFDCLHLLGSRILRDLEKEELNDGFYISTKNEAKGEVSQKTIDSYLESFANLYKNGACGPETHDAFKDVCKHLAELDQKKVGAALKEAVLNKHVDVNLIVQHVKEILETDGFKKVEWKYGNEGKLLMTNKAGTTLEFSFKLNKDDQEKSESKLTIKKAE
jgi:hypothetical protein